MTTKTTTRTISEDNSIRPWLLAARPKTLPAAICPILVAWANTHWAHPERFFVIVFTSLLLQVLSNYSNDLFDGIRGADGASRSGPSRMVQSGIISKKSMLGAIVNLILALSVLGMLLFYWSGPLILVLGILAILSSIGYTAGPFAFAYNGMGEVAVGIFFGLIAILGSEYILLNGALTTAAPFLAFSIGLLAIAILLVNNIRDIEQDRANGKYTLSTKIGRQKSITLYKLCSILPLVSVALGVLSGAIAWTCLLVLLNGPILPLAFKLIQEKGEKLNSLLALTSFLLANFALLYIAGILAIDWYAG